MFVCSSGAGFLLLVFFSAPAALSKFFGAPLIDDFLPLAVVGLLRDAFADVGHFQNRDGSLRALQRHVIGADAQRLTVTHAARGDDGLQRAGNATFDVVLGEPCLRLRRIGSLV